jgi:hypothetical protein
MIAQERRHDKINPVLNHDQLLVWLRDVNLRYRVQGLDAKQRFFQAIKDLVNEHGYSGDFSSPSASVVSEFFKQETKSNSQTFGNLFKGAYFFDSSFFPVEIPISFGSLKVDPLNALTGMPGQLREDIRSNAQELTEYEKTWVLCRDYALGYNLLDQAKVTKPDARASLRKGRDALETVVGQLLELRPNSGAALNSQLAVEIHLKTFLIEKVGLDEAALKKIGHNLVKAIEACQSFTAIPELSPIKADLTVFPGIDDRYKGPIRSNMELWKPYRYAQEVATIIVRLLAR